MTLRTRLAEFLERPLVTRFVMGVIIFNAVLLGLETSKTAMAAAGDVILMLDRLCLAIFVLELALKLFALGGRFFRSGWNLFDLAVVAVALLPATGGLSVLRALRVLRVLRVISMAPSLRRVVEGFLRALPGMGSVVLLTMIIFYVSAVMATKLFGASFPDRFGDLGATALTLFQVMTLEGWADAVVRPVMEVYPYSWIFFIGFILVTTFAVINLLVGLVVNAMQEAAEVDKPDDNATRHAEVMARLEALERRLAERG
jgi:voltage-gated sodium channel